MPSTRRTRRARAPKRSPGQPLKIIPSEVDSPYHPTTGDRAVYYVVGNTYKQNKSSQADSWTLYVDVVQGDTNLIEGVRFDIEGLTIYCRCPVTTVLEDGSHVMRFSTGVQHSPPGQERVTFRVQGRGRTRQYEKRRITRSNGGSRSNPKVFYEPRGIRPWTFDRMPNSDFGIELELSCARGTPADSVAEYIQENARVNVKHEPEYIAPRNRVPFEGWKLVYDGSIACSLHNPECSKFELVSPILTGGKGLLECDRVIKALSESGKIKVNKSMGFHVHVNVEALDLQDYIKVCQNFIKYEDAIDTFMTPSRRTGSEESNEFCKSNKLAIIGEHATNSQRHTKIASCKTLRQLCALMNPNKDRFYKLNMENLRTNRQPTIEFRQHSATSNYNKIAAWVRFCMAFVHNSAKLQRPKCLKGSRETDEQFNMLFQYVIKDRALREFYDKRRGEVRSDDGDDCCTGCAHGGKCSGFSEDLFLPPISM